MCQHKEPSHGRTRLVGWRTYSLGSRRADEKDHAVCTAVEGRWAPVVLHRVNEETSTREISLNLVCGPNTDGLRLGDQVVSSGDEEKSQPRGALVTRDDIHSFDDRPVLVSRYALVPNAPRNPRPRSEIAAPASKDATRRQTSEQICQCPVPVANGLLRTVLDLVAGSNGRPGTYRLSL